jgi:ATP-dependent protease Clp ATPase subunit
MLKIDTRNILFICGGAFVGLTISISGVAVGRAAAFLGEHPESRADRIENSRQPAISTTTAITTFFRQPARLARSSSVFAP